MTGQRLRQGVTAFRIGDPDGVHPIYDTTGSRLFPGRWNTERSPILYASRSYSCALLEKLASGAGRIAENQHFIEIRIQAGSTYETFSEPHNPGWDDAKPTVSKAYGEAWMRSARSLVLLVPSYVARMEQNVLINTAHPEADTIEVSLHRPVWWDERLFAAQP